MTAVCFVLLLILISILASPSSQSLTAFTHLNGSNFLNVIADDELRRSALQDVVRAISASQNWSFRDTAVSKLDARRAMIGSYLRYEFQVHLNGTDLELKFSNEVVDWKKLWKRGKRSRKLKHLVNAIKNLKGVIDTFKLEGPFELKASGNGLLDIQLPSNKSHTGLSRILVGEGITVKVKGVHEVSLFQNSSPGANVEKDKVWQLLNPSCIRIPSVIISGSSTLLAYTPQNRETPIVGTYVTERVFKLMPQKCYSESFKQWPCPMSILRPKVALVDKLVRTIHDGNISNHSKLPSMYILANIKASKVIRFNLELVRKVRRFDNLYDTLPKWRTKPSVERAWFQIVAKYGSGKLKPLIIKKVKHFVVVDSASLSSSLFNVSFTKFPSLAPSDPLTLDINW